MGESLAQGHGSWTPWFVRQLVFHLRPVARNGFFDPQLSTREGKKRKVDPARSWFLKNMEVARG